MRHRQLAAVAITATITCGSVAAPAVGQADESIHGDAARALYCMRAQQEVAGTELVSNNVIHLDPSTFVESDATPYEADDGRDLPLTTHQLITSVPHPFENREMESVVSCKLKGGEAIQWHYGQDQGELGRFCSDAHADITDRVYEALTEAEQARLVYTRGQVVMDPDVPALGGGDWTSGQPQGGDFTLPQIAHEEADGNLHLRSKALIVPTATVDIPPFVPRNKQGTHYCHLIAPDHLREIITGDLTTAAPPEEPSQGPTEPAPAPTTEPDAAPNDAAPVLAETGGGAAVAGMLVVFLAAQLWGRRLRA